MGAWLKYFQMKDDWEQSFLKYTFDYIMKDGLTSSVKLYQKFSFKINGKLYWRYTIIYSLLGRIYLSILNAQIVIKS